MLQGNKTVALALISLIADWYLSRNCSDMGHYYPSSITIQELAFFRTIFNAILIIFGGGFGICSYSLSQSDIETVLSNPTFCNGLIK